MNKGNAKYLSKSHMKKKIEFVCLVCLLIWNMELQWP
jgi:hypothetical protein